MENDNEENPWCVTDLEDFLYYCCPECDQRDKNKDYFLEHALQQHPKSKHWLAKFKVKEELIEDFVAKVEQEHLNDDDVLKLECDVEIQSDVKISDTSKEVEDLMTIKEESTYECEFCHAF